MPTTGHRNPLYILQQPSSSVDISLGPWVISVSKETCADIRDIWCQPLLPGLLTPTFSPHPTPILHRASSIPYSPTILSEPPYANEPSPLSRLSSVHSGTADYKLLQYCVFEETPFLSTCFIHLHPQYSGCTLSTHIFLPPHCCVCSSSLSLAFLASSERKAAITKLSRHCHLVISL